IAFVAGAHYVQPQPERARCGFGLCSFRLRNRIVGIHEKYGSGRGGYQFAQQLQSLARERRIEKLTPVLLAPGRLRLTTRPDVTGSLPFANTIGIVAVAALAASAAGIPLIAAMTAT